MPLLEKGSMDKVKTGMEPLPEMKRVRVKILAPLQDKTAVNTMKDGKSTTLNLAFEIVEGEYMKRIVYAGFIPISIAEDTYCSWNMQTNGRPATMSEKKQMWEDKEYLKDLKKLGLAAGVDFETGDIVDLFGKEILVDIKQRTDNEGEIRNQAGNYRKV